MESLSRNHVSRLLRLRLCCAQASRLASFYEAALGFRQVAIEHLSGAHAKEELGVGGRALRITLALGEQRLALVQFIDQPGSDYPDDATSSDLIFQHFAIVVADMPSAMKQLRAVSGWTPITASGPQQLPPSSGGVTAFKFRDPEGHPLELMAFPVERMPVYWQDAPRGGPFLGIDHSAISVSDVAQSMTYYQALGLKVSNRSINDDPAQARLDHLRRPVVDVVSMSPDEGTPHLELLCYAGMDGRSPLQLQPNDVAATCMIFEVDDAADRCNPMIRATQNSTDPDGHHLSLACSNG
ncbi:MAG: glyoxalase [Proteobacteria bacterium]|nr:glyoxalase [Pseudomonadota bacterium]